MNSDPVVEVDRVVQATEFRVPPAVDTPFEAKDASWRDGDATDSMFCLGSVVVVDRHDVAPVFAGSARDVSDERWRVVVVNDGDLLREKYLHV